MKMNAWYRLWILVSITILSFIGAYLVMAWPEGKTISHGVDLYGLLSSETRSHIVEDESVAKEGIRMSNGHIIYLKIGIPLSRKIEVLRQYENAVADQLCEKRSEMVVKMLKFWLISSIFLLLFGYLIAWVGCGFRRERV